VDSTAIAAWAAVATTLSLAAIGTIWRVGTKLATLASETQSVSQRLRDLASHVEAHDAWHMERLNGGKDLR